jgi:hypothetical protein
VPESQASPPVPESGPAEGRKKGPRVQKGGNGSFTLELLPTSVIPLQGRRSLESKRARHCATARLSSYIRAALALIDRPVASENPHSAYLQCLSSSGPVFIQRGLAVVAPFSLCAPYLIAVLIVIQAIIQTVLLYDIAANKAIPMLFGYCKGHLINYVLGSEPRYHYIL